MVRRPWREASLRVVWDGSRRLNGGLLTCRPELRRPRPPVPDDPALVPVVRRRGRPARAGTRATARVEIRLTLVELRALKALAAANGATIADLIRLAVGDLAADAGRPEAIVFGRDLLDSVR